MVGLASALPWDGKLYATVTGSSNDVFVLDTSLKLTCKDQALMGSSEFQELGELQDLGDAKVNNGKMHLYDYVARIHVNHTHWKVVNYFADGSKVCGVGTVTNTSLERVLPYYCDSGSCWPT